MRVLLGGVLIVAAVAAIVGWLGGPGDAAFFAFFALWGVLVLATGVRPLDGEDDVPAVEDQPQVELRGSA